MSVDEVVIISELRKAIRMTNAKYIKKIKLKGVRIYMALNEVVIISALRTPIGTFNGTLKDISAVELGAKAIKSVIEEVSINVDNIDEVIMGNVLQAGLGQN